MVRLFQEQQLYYKEITEACVGSDEGKRSVSRPLVQNIPLAARLLEM